MGTAGVFSREKLVIAILISAIGRSDELISRLADRWGPVDFASDPFTFTFTHYYDAEMGSPIDRLFISFERLVDPSCLARTKQETNGIEDLFREKGSRKVNLDPGLLSLPRFVLATTKENAHRIPLTEGIYAEITLLYGKGSFRPLPWTYPDFRSEPTLSILNKIRALYKSQPKA
ncbi:MAG: DUF4416 family protein [Spirochaetia bacterium]|jgi:hypothetical protein